MRDQCLCKTVQKSVSKFGVRVNRLWWAFSRRLDLWYGIILGATGFVCACDDQQGRGGICKHVVAVNVHLDRMWHAAKNAKRRMKHIRTPKLRCPHKECRSEDFIKHGTCSEYSTQVSVCRRCTDYLSFCYLPMLPRLAPA